MINKRLIGNKKQTKLIKINKKNIKEYHENISLKFEGEYLKEKRNGKGKEYDSNGKLIFEGEYLNGKRHES